ncbi:superfamily II DNA/RNA helicases SNF2 family [Firmicutes bacterium CAG:129]|nr:superfamily II DNA/RNA helicases SNF2 family [Firmicutes bacterium CAG:129]
MELINNTTKTLKDDLSVEIKQGSKLSIAAACFSIYAFQELKEQLSQIEQLRFIFTSPTFVTEKAKKERREFYIPRLTRERSLYGTEFEIKLRNELTQKAIARECAEWIRQKVTFKSNVSDKSIQGQIVVDSVGYTPINNFTTVELGCEKGNVISTTIVKDESLARTLLADFNEIWNDSKVLQVVTDEVIDSIIRRLTAINLMKRMESSVYSFNLTLTHIKDLINSTIETIDRFDKHSGTTLDLTDISDMDEFDVEDQNSDELFSFGRKVKIDLADMDYVSWRDSLKKDAEVLELLTLLVGDITPEHDSKLQELFRVIDNKITHPINEGNKKLIIFTAFADTAGYLYDNVSRYVKDKYGLNTAMVSGSVEGRTTCPKLRADLNTVLTCFSPISKDKELLMPGDKTEIDVLIATDCISEGQNLQDCDYLINYDIHWNPVRIIQRFGRIDRIGSRNKVIQLVNFWPDVTLDDYINLKAKVETRMKIVDMTATGDDNLLSDEEKTDLEYRKAQLKRLQDEVVDIEDMTTGISIMDLGLNEFRLDLLDYIKHHPDIDKTPFGLHSVVPASEDTPAGVIYVLKNRSNSVNIDNQNRLHPFYMVYIGNDGAVICDHLSPKQMLDKMRFLCKGKTEPIPEAYKPFNKETRDGRNMSQLSKLLGDAIASIIEVKDESDIDSFLGGGQVSFLSNEIKGLDDFELICFLVVR